MALTIDTIELLNGYINGVMDRADHHADQVNEVVLILVGAIIWKATGDISVRTYNDETRNVLWLNVGNNRYALAYNHQTRLIELRERNQNGIVRATFSNQMNAGQVKTIFAQL
jgi:hypothetical protein